jgi:hypothetical protein
MQTTLAAGATGQGAGAAAADPDVDWRAAAELGPAQLAAFCRAHGGALALALGTVLVAGKYLAVARGDTATALAIARAGDKSAMLLGTAVLLMPGAAAAVAGTAGWAACRLAADARRRLRAAPASDGEQGVEARARAVRTGFWAAVAAAVALLAGWCVLLVAPWALPAAVAALALAGAAGRAVLRGAWRAFRGRRRPGGAPPDAGPTRVETAAAAAALVIATGWCASVALSGAMWLPAEETRLADGAVIVGYRLDEHGTTTTFLTEQGRELVSVPNHQIASLRPCALRRLADTRPLAAVVARRPHVPTRPCR